MADHEAAARPYARAVFELARETDTLAAWSTVLNAAAQVVLDGAFLRLLSTPGLDPDRVVETLVDICGREGDRGHIENFIRLLAENRRLPALPAIAARFERLRADVENTLDVLLTAATPVDEAQQARMTQALRKRFGREINLRFKLDENLIGGARLQAEDLVIDGSVRTGLEKLASALVH